MAVGKKSTSSTISTPVETKKEEVVVQATTTTPVVPTPSKKVVKKQKEPQQKDKEVSLVTSSEDEKPSTAEEQKNEENQLMFLSEKIVALATIVKEIQVSLKSVSREFEKQSKIIERIQKKRDNARKTPSGFAKSCKISDELCDFMGIPHGTEKSRTDVTRHINSYVKENNLNNPANRRIILPDDKLKSILNIKDGEDVTFFILQRLISHHFPQKVVKA